MLHVWTDVFGTSDFAVRSLSGVVSVATFVPMWFAGRRVGGRAGAWIAVLILASSPFAIGFGSETRMYSLVMLLVTVGYLAVRRLLERPSLGRQAVVALITGLLLYTHYWSFYLIAVVGALLIWQAWRNADAAQRHAARSALVALVAGAITFLPWIPTFLYQSEHTGTPWGDAIFVTASFAFGLRDFAGGEHSEAYALLVVLIMLVIVAVFGRAIDRYRIELDVRTRPGVRVETVTWVGTLLLGGAFAFVTRGTFAGRYAVDSLSAVRPGRSRTGSPCSPTSASAPSCSPSWRSSASEAGFAACSTTAPRRRRPPTPSEPTPSPATSSCTAPTSSGPA